MTPVIAALVGLPLLLIVVALVGLLAYAPMASANASQTMASRRIVRMWDHDPGATTAQIVTPDGGTVKRVEDMSLFSRFGLGVMATVIAGGGTGVTLVEICASDAADGTGNVTVIKATAAIVADAQGDWVWLECMAEEVRQLSQTNRYIFGRITCNNAGDEAAVIYELDGLRFPVASSTPATTIA